MELFKGYVPTKDKKCLISFKNKSASEFHTYRQIKNHSEFAGILNDETILIDIDDFHQSEVLMTIVEDLQLRCRVYETSRGKHFLFKNTQVDKCYNGVNLACCLKSDIKVGCKASYSILKFDGKERKIIYDIFDDEEYEEIPKWLTPIKTNTDFLNMEAGDGRNQALFNYILTLQSHDFSVEEARDTIKFINKYVLKEPLADSELDVILRDDAFQKPIFFKKNVFLFDKFATYLKNNNRIIKINNQLHIYKDGVYVDGETIIEAEMIKHIPNLNRSKRAEVLAYLDVLIQKNHTHSSANFIAFKNGVYDLSTDQFLDFSPDYIITNKINWNYNPDAYSDITENSLMKMACNDLQIKALLEEVIGYTFYRRNELRKAFILIGDKANGKSTYLDMIKTLLGDENTCSLDLKEIGDRFRTAEIFRKLANIGDDIGDEFIQNPAMFKKVVSGESITAERKGKDPFQFKPYSKMLFSANNIPRIKDKSGAVIDRLVIIPFNAQFTKDDEGYDPYIKYKLRQAGPMEYLIKIGLEGLKRVLENRGFTVCDRVKKEIQEYEEKNNPILVFFKEIELDEIVNHPTKEAYFKYQEFCIANAFQPMSNIEFSKQTKKHFNLDIVDKKIKGIKYRVFAEKGA